MQFATDLGSDLGSEAPFHSKQIHRDPGLRAYQWCRTCLSGNGNYSLLITSKGSQLAIQFFHYRLPLFPVQLCTVSRVNIVVKSNKFPFPMILLWDRKRVNVARYSMEGHLIGWWVGRPRPIALFLSLGDKQTSEADRTRPFHSISGRVGSPSRASEADWMPDVVKKPL